MGRPVIDIKGQRFGMLIALGRSDIHGKWDCLCDCGNSKTVKTAELRHGISRHCGCAHARIIDETGNRYGKLLVTAINDKSQRGVVWGCLCDCGRTRFVVGAKLRDGTIGHCGCDGKPLGAQTEEHKAKCLANLAVGRRQNELNRMVLSGIDPGAEVRELLNVAGDSEDEDVLLAEEMGL